MGGGPKAQSNDIHAHCQGADASQRTQADLRSDESKRVGMRLAASRAVRWRGRGELLHVPWDPPTLGPVLLLDLWAGVSSAAMALLSLGVRFFLLAVGEDSALRAIAEENLDQIVHLNGIQEFSPDMLDEFMAKRQVKAILVGGSSRCRGSGFQDIGLQEKLGKPMQLKGVCAGIISRFPQVPILAFFENDASLPQDARLDYNNILGAEPIMISAGMFGWVESRSYWWGLGSGDFTVSDVNLDLPAGASWVIQEGIPRVKWSGKPIPSKFQSVDGFDFWRHDPQGVVAAEGDGAMSAFMHESMQEGGRTAGSAAARKRWLQDGKQHPISAYEDRNLLWKGWSWRALTAEERAILHGLPPAAPKPDSFSRRNPMADVEKIAGSAVDNGLHMPSAMLFMILLLQGLGASAAGHVQCRGSSWSSGMRTSPDEADLRQRIHGTIFDDTTLMSTPGLLGANDFVKEMQALFIDLDIPVAGKKKLPWVKVAQQLIRCEDDLAAMQVYWAYRYRLGWRGTSMGPSWATQKERAKLYASMGMQRATSVSSRGLDHLLAPGLGPTEHIRQALKLGSPFEPESSPDEDITFAAEVVGTWGPWAGRWREKQRLHSERVMAALEPLRVALQARMPDTVKRVAKTKNPAMVAACIIALRWPDRQLAMEYVMGHRLVGHQPSSNLFRQINQDAVEDTMLDECFFGSAAATYISDLVARKVSPEAQEIEELLEVEFKKGYQSKPLTLMEMNRKYGTGGWRPMPLFLHEESSGKKRLIANGKGGGHNAATSEEETLYVIGTSFVMDVVRAFVNAILIRYCGMPERKVLNLTKEEVVGLIPDWVWFGLGCEDMTDAFRQSPVAPCHQRANIVAYYSVTAGAWRFVEVYGMVYGMRSSVLHFSRFPTLAVAVARRIGGAGTGNYMDDFTCVDVGAAGRSGQSFTQFAVLALGGQLSPAKHIGLRGQRVMLGVHIRMDEVESEGIITFEPKVETVEKVVMASRAHLSSGSMTPAEASKLRGLSGWCAANTFGRAGRLGLSQLKTRQYSKELQDFRLDENLRMCLMYLITILPMLQPRQARVFGRLTPPVVVYSDASWPEGVQTEDVLESFVPPRVGWVIFRQGERPHGYSMQLGRSFLRLLLPRKTQIFAAEAVVALLALVTEPELFVSEDVLWFMDNEAAVSSLIRGSSRASDVGHIAAAARIASVRLGCRIWYEWIDTASNPSDGLSRAGTIDPWTLEQGWCLREVCDEQMTQVGAFLTSDLVRRFVGSI